MRDIFISYRRNDAEGEAGRLFDELARKFGRRSLFMDVTTIEPGRDFRRVIDENVSTCGALLAIIGTNWLDVRNARGERRLDDPADFVRLETASALKRNIPVIPVLVRGAIMPPQEALPEDIKDLAYRSAVELTHVRWSGDLKVLVKALRPLVQQPGEQSRAPQKQLPSKPTQEEHKHVVLSGDWSAKPETAEFSCNSPDEPSSMLMFDRPMRDGRISASVTAISGQLDPNFGQEFRECGLLFRYTDRESFYVAGVGGFGMQYYIAKVTPSEWRLLEGAGHVQYLNFHEPYELRVELNSSRITLFHSDVPVLNAVDDTYFSGFCGLRCNRTQAEFRNVDIQAVRPRCVVIMPFDKKMNFVYPVIKEAVENAGMDCFRTDDRSVAQPVMEDVKNQIAASDLVLLDFTARNPNVYYQAGLADAWKKKWIVLTQSTAELAFDLGRTWVILYTNKLGSDSKLRRDLHQILAALFGDKTSLTGR